MAGTLFHSTKLPLTTWFLAIYLVSQSKNTLSALSFKRQLGLCYRTACRMKHKLMEAMARREDRYTLEGRIEVDDAYLGGEHTGGKGGGVRKTRSPLSRRCRPMRTDIRCTPSSLQCPGSRRRPSSPGDRLFWRRGAPSFGSSGLLYRPFCAGFPPPKKTGGRKPKDLPQFHWVNTILGNLKSALSGTYHAFNFSKYAHRYLSEFSYRFNRRFHLKGLPVRLLVACATTGPCPERWLRLETEDWR